MNNYENLLLRIYLIPYRIRFRWRNRKRQKISEDAINATRYRLEEARRCGSINLDKVYNVGLYIVLFERDLSAYSSYLFLSKTVWHRQFAARGMAVLLYEGCEDIPELLGKEFRRCLKDLELGDNWFQQLNDIMCELNKFKIKHAEFLKKVRNYVGAHREKNALAQIDVLDNLNPIDVYRLGAAFSDPLRAFFNFQIKLMQYVKFPSIMLKEAIKIAERPSI